MKHRMTYRKSSLLLAGLMILTAVGCSGGEGEDSETSGSSGIETTAAETVSLGESDFKGKEVGVITSLNIDANVGTADFEYLATLTNLEYVTVDAKNAYFKSSPTPRGGGCVLWSAEDNSILYIPDSDDLIALDIKAVADSFTENSTIKLYVKGAVLDVKYNRGGDDDYWFVSRIEYGSRYINFAKPLRFNGTRELRVYSTDEALVFALGYSVWDHAVIFAGDEMYELNPEFGDFGADDSFLECDGFRLFVGSDGRLRFESVAASMVDMNTEDWYVGFLRSREQVWKKEGRVDLGESGPSFNTEKYYTIDDWFETFDTDIDDWFENADTGFATLDELLESNDTAEKLDYTEHGVNMSKYKKSRTAVKNGVYTGYSLSRSFTNSMYPKEKFSFVMKLPQLNSTKPGAAELNDEIANKYFYRYSEYILQLEKSAKDCSARLNLSYTTFKYGDITIISIYESGGILGTGAIVNIYDVYYYDNMNDRTLSHDEFIRLYSGNALTLTDLLRMINDLDTVKHIDDESQIVTEDRFFGIIPETNGRFYALFEGFRIEGRDHAAGYYDGKLLAETDYTQKNV